MSLLVIALSGADGGVIRHLLDEGRMPFLLDLIESGASGDITWTSGRSAVADWLTVATGAAAEEHGVWANPVCRADGFGVTFAERSNLRMTPVWERVAAQDNHVHVVGWPAMHRTCSTEEIPGLSVVADTFFYVEGRSAANWPAFPESVCPRFLTRDMVSARVHPEELKGPLWRQRLGAPGEALVKVAGQKGLAQLARLESTVSVSKRLGGTPAARFVFLDMVEALGLPKSQEELMGVLAAYTLLDMAVGRLIALAGNSADVVVLTRPPQSALMSRGAITVPSGLSVFKTQDHEPDSLLPAITPMELAAVLGNAAGAGNSVIPEPEATLDTELPAGQLAQRLAARHGVRCRPMRADRVAMEHVEARDRAATENITR